MVVRGDFTELARTFAATRTLTVFFLSASSVFLFISLLVARPTLECLAFCAQLLKAHQRGDHQPVPFSGGHKPIPRSVTSVCIFSMDLCAATSGTGTAGGGHQGHQQGRDRMTATWVSSTAGVITPPPPRHSSSFLCSLIWSCGGAAKASASVIGRLPPTTLFSSFQTPDARCVPLS